MANPALATPPTLAARQNTLTDATAAEEARDRTEDQLNELFSRIMRRYLARVEKALNTRVQAGTPALTAAGEPSDPITLGMLAGWWAAIIDEQVMAEVLDVWRQTYGTHHDDITSAVRTTIEEYLPRVRDRLVRGDVYIGGQLAPSVAEDTFERARTVLARSAAMGWSRAETARRLATAFGWETNGPQLREDLADIDGRMDAILDALGHPGHPAREYARLNDPVIRELREQRNEIIKQLDAERSYWENRARLIARTESTSLHGYGANRALAAEGFTYKEWIATHDGRTRPEHAEADHQTVPVDSAFTVGGFSMQFPGDPAAPVGMIANCRCTMIGADHDDADGSAGDSSDGGPGGPGSTPPGFGEPPPDPADREKWNAYWARRQTALEGTAFTSNGEILEPHEIEFAERFTRMGQRLEWIPRDPKFRPTNDFIWFRGARRITMELKTTKAKHATIRTRIQSAVRKAEAQNVVKDNFIIDLGNQRLTDELRHQLAGYNAGRRKYRIAALWVMSRGRTEKINLRP